MVKAHNKRKKRPGSKRSAKRDKTSPRPPRNRLPERCDPAAQASNATLPHVSHASPKLSRFRWDLVTHDESDLVGATTPPGASTDSRPTGADDALESSALDQQSADLHASAPLEPELRPDDETDDADDLLRASVSLQKSRFRARLAGSFCILAGLSFSAWVGRDIASDRAAQSWPTVPGRVTLSQTELVSRQPDRVEHHFAYEYKTADGWHTGRQVRFAGGQGDPVKEHRVGDRIKVYVKPSDSTAAVLKPGVIPWAWAQLAFGLVITALGAIYVLLAGRERSA